LNGLKSTGNHGFVRLKKSVNQFWDFISIAAINKYEEMEVSTHGGIPKWMVYFMENPMKMDHSGVSP